MLISYSYCLLVVDAIMHSGKENMKANQRMFETQQRVVDKVGLYVSVHVCLWEKESEADKQESRRNLIQRLHL